MEELVYRLIFEFYATEPRARLNALFEHEMHGKTQKLAEAGIWCADGDRYSNIAHDQMLGELSGLIPVVGGILRARLEQEIPGLSDTL